MKKKRLTKTVKSIREILYTVMLIKKQKIQLKIGYFQEETNYLRENFLHLMTGLLYD